MKRAYLVGIGLLVGNVHVDTAVAEPLSPAALLRAREKMAYTGTIAVTRPLPGGGTYTAKLRLVRGKGQRQRHEFLDRHGATRDLVISDGSLRWHADLARKAVYVSPMDADSTLAARTRLLATNYAFKVLGQLRHMGRLTLLAQFTPRYPGNLTHRLWVDQQTHLPLVVERREPSGALVDRCEFVNLDLRPPISDRPFQFQLPPGTSIANGTLLLAEGAGNTPLPKGMRWRPEPPHELPDGYVLLHWQHDMDEHRVPTFTWHYHDGLSLISCFATAKEAASAAPAGAESLIINGRTAYTLARGAKRLLAWRTTTTAYTLVGHVPLATLAAIANSTR